MNVGERMTDAFFLSIGLYNLLETNEDIIKHVNLLFKDYLGIEIKFNDNQIIFKDECTKYQDEFGHIFFTGVLNYL